MQHLLDLIDPRLRPHLEAEWLRRRQERLEGLPRGVTVVLAGQRAAGKSTLLAPVATELGREGVDLDAWLERTHRRSIREWFVADERGFRDAERSGFRSLRPGLVVSVGGGFLSNHHSVLRDCVVVEVPVSFDTYCERLANDPMRPRLRPELSLQEELSEVYDERTRRHAEARPMSFVEFLLRLRRGSRARRVVTLPPQEALEPFAWAARRAGADLLEVRTDLHPPQLDLLAASRAVPLLLAERGAPIPDAWLRRSAVVDREDASASLVSWHAPEPLSLDAALAHWNEVPVDSAVKHVEPLGDPARFPQVLELQTKLLARFGEGRVTLLVTGDVAAPFRAVLAARNALDYVALNASWKAAPGQRLLADVVREARCSTRDASTERLGIFGASLAHSRSPRVHVQPFDRLELPADANLRALIDALRPHYRGFALTNPFKQVLGLGAVNTLVRSADGWRSENTDVEGARVAWESLGRPSRVNVLGEGGVTAALRLACPDVEWVVMKRASLRGVTVTGPVVWTWPPEVDAPEGLRLEGATVVVVSYGAPGRRIAAQVEALGGVPKRVGARWFIAQARRQRELWSEAVSS